MKKDLSKTAFINFNTLLFDNVFKTQVLNWIIHYQKYGINFDLVMFKPLKSILKDKSEELHFIRKRFKNKLYYRYLINPKYSFSGLYTFIVFILIILKYNHKKRIIIQIRSAYYFKIFKNIKKIFGDKIIIIFDSRGAIAEEYKYVQQKLNGSFDIKEYEKLIKFEREMIKISDIVFCVSNALVEYHISQNNNLNRNKFFVSPCNADSQLFFYSKELRDEYRKRLNIEKDKKVIVYSGGLQAPWHIPDKIFEFFSKIQKYSDIYFLMLTNDVRIASSFSKKYGLKEDKIQIISLENSQINNYLNAADIGILFRENEPINNVASPSKFAEYIMAGLPVLISDSIGDFSKFVKKQNVGKVISLDFKEEYIKDIYDYIGNQLTLRMRENIANIGEKNFSKQNNIKEKIYKYLSLV